MTENQKKLIVLKGLELYVSNKGKDDFFDYLNSLIPKAQDFFIPYFEKLKLIKCFKTRSGKYTMQIHEKHPTKDKIDELIFSISNDKISL